MMIYATYAEGFTSQSTPLTTIGPTAVPPPGCTDRSAIPGSTTQVFCTLPVESVENKEVGLRSDWLQGKLRFNATYFDSLWTGMRVTLLPQDASHNTQPFPYQSGEGKGTASGWEFEVVWLAAQRLRLNFGLGLISTNYIQSGVFDGTTGNYPGSPFAYAPEHSGTIGANYEIPLSSGGHIVLVGDYGYMGPYARDAAYQRTLIDANGKPVLEPAYGILNGRFVYEPANRKYSFEVWGKNLTDELYINGGFDTRDTWGYDFAIVGRSREVGVTLSFSF
jgi:iron complex outermembrane receptor protein